jgi:hypothetical protein
MKNLVKLGVAGALALGGSMTAHASITVPTSSGTTGDLVLWADVFNGSTLVQAYVGDTGISVDSAGGGTLPSTFTDANLNTLLSKVTGSNTIFWVLEGGWGHAGPAMYLVSSNPGTFNNNLTGNTLNGMGLGVSSEINNVVNALPGIAGTGAGTGGSGLSSSDNQTAGVGTGFNPFAVGTQDATNWYNETGNVSTNGLGTQATFYLLTAGNQSTGTLAKISSLFNVSLTASGLTFSPLSAVPLPAALWLLGSGLLGLAGVARRKVSAA